MVIEFQKRGLPHAHILVILQQSDKPITDDDYDKFVCAEIPNPSTHPRLYSMVTNHMIHGPCGDICPNQVCMDKETCACTKSFPKPLSEATTHDEDSFPSYRRRGLHTCTKRIAGRTVELDDSWVVPFNHFMMYKFNAHINVEI